MLLWLENHGVTKIIKFNDHHSTYVCTNNSMGCGINCASNVGRKLVIGAAEH